MAEATGDQAPRAYFDTPERAERLQLVAHVIRNTEATPYVRGPEGAGKSRFAERLAAIFRQETTLVSIAGTAVSDVPQAVCDALGVSTDRWPAAAIDAAPDNGLLVLVDDVDRVSLADLEALQELREVGAKLLFLGESDPVALSIGWELQLIDLPPLSESQLRDFLAFLGQDDVPGLKGGALTRLLRNSKGLPGLVLELLEQGAVAKPTVSSRQGVRPGRWLGVGALVAVVGLVIWQQDRINALFEPPSVDERSGVAELIPEPEPQRALPGPEMAPPVHDVEVAAPVVPEPVEMVESAPKPDVADARPTADVPAQPAPEGGAPESVSVESPAAEAAGVSPAPEVEPAESLPEPAEPAVEVEPAAPETAETEPEPEPGTLAWLRRRDPKAMTLQLVGARDRGAIDEFIAKHKLSGVYAVYERDLGGKPWYSLVYGEYPDMAAAKRARAKLPKALHSAWPRSFESVIQQLPPEE